MILYFPDNGFINKPDVSVMITWCSLFNVVISNIDKYITKDLLKCYFFTFLGILKHITEHLFLKITFNIRLSKFSPISRVNFLFIISLLMTRIFCVFDYNFNSGFILCKQGVHKYGHTNQTFGNNYKTYTWGFYCFDVT